MKNLSFYPSTQSKIRIKSILWNPGPRIIQSTPENQHGHVWVPCYLSVKIIVRLSPGPGPNSTLVALPWLDEINPTIGPKFRDVGVVQLQWTYMFVNIFWYIFLSSTDHRSNEIRMQPNRQISTAAPGGWVFLSHPGGVWKFHVPPLAEPKLAYPGEQRKRWIFLFFLLKKQMNFCIPKK